MKSKTKFYLMAVAGASALVFGAYNFFKKMKGAYNEALDDLKDLEGEIQERGEWLEIESISEKFKYYYIKDSNINLEERLKELASVEDVVQIRITTQDGSKMRGDEWFKYYYKGAI